MNEFTLTKEEHKELIEAYETSEATPVIALTIAEGIGGRDFATIAQDRLRSMMEKLGKKYGYKPETGKISSLVRSFMAEEI